MHPHCPPAQSQSIDAVLSHAHEDHFNGFKALYDQGRRDLFENAYIPMFCMKDLNTLGGVLIKYSIFLYRYYGPSTLIGTNAKNWLLAAPVLAGLSKKLWCVNAEHHVAGWGHPNKILWPPLQDDISQRLSERLNQYLEKNSLPEDYLNDESQNIRKQLDEFYSMQGKENEGRKYENDQIVQAISIIENVINIELDKNQKERLSNPIGLNNFAFKPTIDNHSLIFEIGGKKEQDLYLSDADDKTVVEMLHNNSISDKKYRIIKSGHHGNRGARALYNENITADEVINCCGPAHSKWNGPDISYQSVSGNLTCTDWKDGSNKWQNKSQFTINQSCCVRR